MSGNTRKNQVTRLVTLRHRSIMSGALGMGAQISQFGVAGAAQPPGGAIQPG